MYCKLESQVMGEENSVVATSADTTTELCQKLEDTQQKLRVKLEMNLAAKEEEINCLKARLETQKCDDVTCKLPDHYSPKKDSISEISELKMNVSKLEAQLQQIAQDLRDSKANSKKDEELYQFVDRLSQKEIEIKDLRNQLETNLERSNERENKSLISEISELKANAEELQGQLKKTAKFLSNAKKNFDELRSKHRNLQLDLEKKDAELNRTKEQLKMQAAEVQMKTRQVSDEMSKRTTWEHANQLLQTELSSLRRRLSSAEDQLKLSIKETQAEQAKCIEKCNEWNSKCQALKNQCSALKKELNSNKSVKVTVCDMCAQLVKLAERIDHTRGRIVYTGNRTSLYGEIKKMTAAYKRQTLQLELRKVIMPNNNFAILLSQYRSIYDENTVKWQQRLNRVDQIQAESTSLSIMKNVDASSCSKAVNNYLSQLDQLEWSSVDELEKERKLCEDVKKAYQEAKTFFNSVNK